MMRLPGQNTRSGTFGGDSVKSKPASITIGGYGLGFDRGLDYGLRSNTEVAGS